MLDDFREQADSSSFFDEEESNEYNEVPIETKKQFLGMTPVQRFVIAFLLLAIVCLIGTFALLATEKVVLPFI
jgi:hypothetical protein